MSILKKSSVFTLLLSLIMVMAMSVTAFGEEAPVDQESVNAVAVEESASPDVAQTTTPITLTGAKFVKADGSDYALGMGTGVIQSAKMNGNTVTIYLKKKKVLWYRGWITQAYYTTPYNPEEDNLVFGEPGQSTYRIELDASRVGSFANNKWGIHLSELHFAFTPSDPPGMPNPVENAYFVCDQFGPPAQ